MILGDILFGLRVNQVCKTENYCFNNDTPICCTHFVSISSFIGCYLYSITKLENYHSPFALESLWLNNGCLKQRGSVYYESDVVSFGIAWKR